MELTASPTFTSARKDQSFERADDRGVAQIFLRVFERSPGLRHLRLHLAISARDTAKLRCALTCLFSTS